MKITVESFKNKYIKTEGKCMKSDIIVIFRQLQAEYLPKIKKY